MSARTDRPAPPVRPATSTVAGRRGVTNRSQRARVLHAARILRRMTDTDRPAPKPWLKRRTTQAGIILLLLIAWSLAASQWQNKDCGTAQSYGLVISHFGTPGHTQGCESEPGGPAFTDDYQG